MSGRWYPAPSLKRLEAQVNALWPNRSRVSDGFKGDDDHANRVSDHNPAPPKGVVRAWDVTSSGIDKQMVIDAALVDPRTRYIITDGRIARRNAAGGFTWSKYTGPNGHFSHIHISIRHFDWAEDDTSDWRLATMTPAQEAKLDRAIAIATENQKRINAIPEKVWGAEVGKGASRRTIATVLASIASKLGA